MINLLLGLDRSTYCLNLENICENCKKIGFDGIEIQPEHPDIWNDYPKSAKKINNILESYNFKITVHCPIKDLNMASYNEKIREVTLKELIKAERFADELNARYFLIHAGKNSFVSQSLMSKKWKKKAIDLCIESISKILENANCKITMENMTWSEWRFSSKKKYLLKIYEKFPVNSLYFTLDVAHALERSRVFAKKLLELFGKRLISIHFGDFKLHGFVIEDIIKNKSLLENFNYIVLEPHTLPLSSKKDLLFSLLSKQITLIRNELHQI